MRAARLHAYHEPLKVDEVDEPKITGPLDVIVRIGAAGLCRTDLHIQEGQWAEKSEVKLPYTPGHENAGWIHEVGSAVTNVEVGDTVIVHPFITCGLCRACRAGDDMHCENGSFPGINRDGGFADFLLTSARSVVKLDPSLHPADIAALADAGLTAIHAVKKAIPVLGAGSQVVVIGAGGLGHIGIQCLKAYTPTEIIVVDPSEAALALARELGRRPHRQGRRVKHIDTVLELTDGLGAEAIIDFVGEKGAIEDGVAMIEDGGFYYVIGYGQNIDIPTIDVISREISFIGNLVGTYVDLQDLMTLTAQGKVTLHTSTYPLDAINDAMADLDQRAAPGPRDPRPAGVTAAAEEAPDGQATALQPRGPPAAAGRRRRAGQHRQGDAGPEGPQRRPRAPHRRADDHQRRRLDRPRDRALRPVQEHGRAARPRGRQQDVATSPATARRPPRCWPRRIVREGMRALDEGVNPMLLRRGIEEAIELRRRRAAALRAARRGPRQLAHIATIAAKEDEVIGDAVAEALRSRRRRGRRDDRGGRPPRRQRRVRRGDARRERLDVALHGPRPRADGDGLRGPLHPHDEQADLAPPRTSCPRSTRS